VHGVSKNNLMKWGIYNMEGFTVTCNKCGGAQVFNEDDRLRADNIEIIPELSGTYELYFSHLTVYCETVGCGNNIDLKG
jgi:hypothetical protein